MTFSLAPLLPSFGWLLLLAAPHWSCLLSPLQALVFSRLPLQVFHICMQKEGELGVQMQLWEAWISHLCPIRELIISRGGDSALPGGRVGPELAGDPDEVQET